MSEAKPTEKRRPIRHLTSAQKAEAIALWRSGTVTLDDLARKFKKDRTTFARLFEKEGVKKGEARQETERKVQAAVEQTILNDATILANRIRETKEDHYKYANGLAKLTWSIIVKATQEGRPIGTTANDMKAIQSAAQALKIAREERYAVLGITDKDDNDDKPLPDLVVQELTAEDIKAMHNQQIISDEEMGEIALDDLGDEALVQEDGDDEDDDRVEVE